MKLQSTLVRLLPVRSLATLVVEYLCDHFLLSTGEQVCTRLSLVPHIPHMITEIYLVDTSSRSWRVSCAVCIDVNLGWPLCLELRTEREVIAFVWHQYGNPTMSVSAVCNSDQTVVVQIKTTHTTQTAFFSRIGPWLFDAQPCT